MSVGFHRAPFAFNSSLIPKVLEKWRKGRRGKGEGKSLGGREGGKRNDKENKKKEKGNE